LDIRVINNSRIADVVEKRDRHAGVGPEFIVADSVDDCAVGFIVNRKCAVDEFHEITWADRAISVRRLRPGINPKGAGREVLTNLDDERRRRVSLGKQIVNGEETQLKE